MKATTILLCLLAVPALAQTPTAPANPRAVPLPQWFVDMDTGKKGEVSRSDFVKYRMKSFNALDADKDGKLSIDEFIKIAEPPYSSDVPGGASLDERRNRARADFQSLDSNADGFLERTEAEAAIQAEFSRYDTDRDNKITEPELRLIVQRGLQRQASERQREEAQRRHGMLVLSDLIDMQMRDADRLDRNGDGKVNQHEYLTLAGPADGPQAQGLLPYDVRKQLLMRKFEEIDSNRDGIIDRVELTAYALKEFLEMDLNKDRFLDEDELTKAREADAAKVQAILPTLLHAAASQHPAPPHPSPPRPAPVAPARNQPQGTR